MSFDKVQRPDAPEGRSAASASGPGTTPRDNAGLPAERRAQIAARAYEMAERRGFASGNEIDDWLQAEREVEAGPPRNTPPDNPSDTVNTRSNE